MAALSENRKRLLDSMAADCTDEEAAYLATRLPAGTAVTSWQSGLAFKWIKTDCKKWMLSDSACGFTTAINKFCTDNSILMVCRSPNSTSISVFLT
jgi:hypothetical protein